MSEEQPARLWIPDDNRPAPLTVASVPILAEDDCQMSFGERAALEGILSQCKPRVSLELGTYEGGSLRFLAAHSQHVHTLDLYDVITDHEAFRNVSFYEGNSRVVLPEVLRALEREGVEIDFALVDGDHSAEGVRLDLDNLLESSVSRSTVILLHDTMKTDTRAGIEAVGLRQRAKVAYYELDFIPGYEFAGGHFDGQVGGGLGLVVTGDRETSGYGQEPRQARYREPFGLLHRGRRLPGTLQPVIETTSPFPMPPDELIDRVVSGFSNEEAEEHRALFLQTGQRSLGDLEAALVAVGDQLAAHERILEFGCGCGRIMRWMADFAGSSTLVGTDIDARAVEWAAENLPFARFDVNGGRPPTGYEDRAFDLIVNHSVFTHLDASYQDLWLEELRRITAPGGLVVLSIHGEHAFQTSEQQLAPGARQRHEWRAQLERDGILFIADDTYVGSVFPDFYHTTFHAPWYVFEHWSRWFEVLAYLPRSSLDFQDQVVLRRREDADDAGTPIHARPGGDEASLRVPSPSVKVADLAHPLTASTAGSRFGRLGLLARRAIFRVARPVLYAQEQVDRSLAERVAQLDERLGEARDERMPPLVHVALRQQAERINRLESDLLDHSSTEERGSRAE